MLDLTKIRERRQALNLNLKQLAHLANITFVTLHNIETGKTPDPSYLKIQQIEETLERLEDESVQAALEGVKS